MFIRVWNMVWKEVLQFWRYKLLLLFILAFPVLNMLGAAEAVSAQILDIPTAVCDQDQSPTSRRLVEMLRGSRLFAPDTYVGSQAELEALLEHGTVKIGLVIPPDFGADLAGGRRAAVQVLQDGSETTTALLAGAYLEGASCVYGQRLLGVEVGSLASVDPRSRIWFNEEMRKETFQLPAEMAAAVAMLAMLLPAVAIVRERERGTLEQLFVTPMRSIELLSGKGIVAAVIAFIGFLESLALITLYLGVPFRGSLALLMALTIFYIFVEMGWGLFVSAVVRTQGQALLAAFFWLMLESVLSGQILPVENMPAIVRMVAQLAPNTHFAVIVRHIMLRGSGLADLWPQVAALVGLGCILYALAAVRLRKRLD
ncbi:MAG: ABC transporter permease [Anaerolineae bacterium]|nr:ABC transporter permease [Anaerolineae bacterium]